MEYRRFQTFPTIKTKLRDSLNVCKLCKLHSGFTLIENAVAFMIIFLVLFSLFELLTHSSLFILKAKNRTTVLKLAESIIETARTSSCENTGPVRFSSPDNEYIYNIICINEYAPMQIPQILTNANFSRINMINIIAEVYGPVNPDNAPKPGYVKVELRTMVIPRS